MNARSFFYQLGKLIYQIDGLYDEYGRKSKISSLNLLWILYALNDGKKHSQKNLCDDWAIPRSTANTIIKELENKNYVTLSQIAGQRRELLISLTPLGKDYADNILKDLYQKEKEIYKSIDNADVILSLLNDLVKKMQLIANKEE